MPDRFYDHNEIERGIKNGKRFLILNADDMGMSTGVTDGIARAYEQGLVTDISMIQSMPDSERAARIAAERGMNVGVHLDLTRQKRRKIVGRPLLGDEVPSLTDEEGYFLGSTEFRKRMFGGDIDMGEVEREIGAQIDRAIEWGLDLTHIDSNEGMHNYYPPILKMVLERAEDLNLPVRWPNPAYLDWLDQRRILTTDHLNFTFYDVPAEEKRDTFLNLLDELRPGVTEFIFHPAVPDEGTKALTAWERRAAELDLLIEPGLGDELESRGIVPISFYEIRERQRELRRGGRWRLRAGSAKVGITPPFGTQMGGYFDRHDITQGTHDELGCRGIYMSDGRQGVLLLSVDLLYVDAHLVEKIRARISGVTGVDEEAVMVFATHTHSGPEGHSQIAQLMGFIHNPALEEFLVERISSCGIMAVSGSRYARLGFESVKVEDMNVNRQKEGGPVDPDMQVLSLEDLEGEPIGGLVNFTAHPVIMGSDNLLFSSEYPGRAMRVLEEALGGGSVYLFANGACGDVTIRRRRSSFSEVERIGNRLGGYALQALGGVDASEEVSIGVTSASVHLDVRSLPSREEAMKEVDRLSSTEGELSKEDRKRLKRALGTASLAERSDFIRSMLGERKRTEVQLVSVNDSLLVGVPAELFVRYALDLKDEMKPKRVILVGYCNDMVGYVVTPEAFEEGGYEAGVTLFEPHSGAKMLDTVRAMIEKA